MRTRGFLIAVAGVLFLSGISYGMASEQVGPDTLSDCPAFDQPGWPTGTSALTSRGSRVYSREVNGNEHIYFDATPPEAAELITRFSEIRMRDHELWIKDGTPQASSFDGAKIDYNLDFHMIGGIALSMATRDERPETYDPTLTLYVDPKADQAHWLQLDLPDNIILHNESAVCPLKGKASKPARNLWYARVNFADGTPATDFEHDAITKVTLWEKSSGEGIKLGSLDRDGWFHAAFSADEIANLKANDSWLTLTVGNWSTKAKPDDPRLDLGDLSSDKAAVIPATVAEPDYYYGRILFEDGSPAVLDPAPWGGAKIQVLFPGSGSVEVDADGYFQVYLTEENYQQLQKEAKQKNVYIPRYDQKNTSTALYAFPASKLSHNKAAAGILTIERPKPGDRKARTCP